jgi:hypothetical protein
MDNIERARRKRELERSAQHDKAAFAWQNYYSRRLLKRMRPGTACQRHVKMVDGRTLHVTKGYRKA